MHRLFVPTEIDGTEATDLKCSELQRDREKEFPPHRLSTDNVFAGCEAVVTAITRL
jgi:hypothetical protein